jgi:tetratricopeptide (TPR) repeat protein
VQVGSLAQFPNMAFDRQILEQTANITARMTDERSQSVVTPVLGVLNVLQAADGNGYEMMRLIAILDQLNITPLEIEGSGLSAHVQRSIQQYFSDTPASIAEMTAGAALDPANPIIYTWRSGGRERLGQYNEALQDARSAARLGPQNWALPLYLRGNVDYLQNDLDGALDTYSQIITQRPDDWFPYNMRGWFHYLKGEYDLAKADYARAFELKPDANFPYIISALIAIREGRMSDARTYLNTILREYPDPTFANRLINAAFGDQADKDVVGPMFAAVGDFTLEQFDQMLADTQKALAVAPNLSDLHALEGFAYCNLKEYKEAEQSYDKLAEMVPDIPLVYVLRADVRLKQLNILGANDDDNKARQLIQQTGQGNELIAYLDAGLRGEVGCDNFLEWQPPG